MNKTVLLILSSCCLLIESKNFFRVSIIGGGISGSSAATFLKQEFAYLESSRNSKNISFVVDLYDQNQNYGGRIQTLHWSGNQSSFHFELGASILHDSNYYMKSFAKNLNLTTGIPPRTNKKLGIFDGDSFSFKTSVFSLVSFFSFLWHFGANDFIKLKREVGKVADKFAEFYRIQNATDVEVFLAHSTLKSDTDDSRISFPDLKSLLKSVDLYDLTQMSVEEFLVGKVGLSKTSPLLRELVAAAVRVNYNQPLHTMNALAGAVGIIPLTNPDLFSVTEGNARIPELLATRYVDNSYLGHTVHTVRKNSRGAFLLEGVKRSEGSENSVSFQSMEYDVVVIATALETSQLKFEDEFHRDEVFYSAESPNNGALNESLTTGSLSGDLKASVRRYKQTVATFVEGRLKPAYFSLVDQDYRSLPGSLLTIDRVDQSDGVDHIGFTSIGSYLENLHSNTTVYKVFSHEALSTVQLEQMFEYIHRSDNHSEGFHTSVSSDELEEKDVHQGVFRKDWAAYPLYQAAEPIETSTSFAPHPGVFYVNAFEGAVSCMECMVVAAKNVALLVGKEMRARLISNDDVSTSAAEGDIFDTDVEKDLQVGERIECDSEQKEEL